MDAALMIDTHVLWSAVCEGAFPMADDEGIQFFRCPRRAVIPIEGIKVSRSLARRLRKGEYLITLDQAFEEVMRSCGARPDTWISEELIHLYLKAHREGWAHSAEAWWEGELVGGVYGLAVGATFCGESMFTRRTDAGKVALHELVRHCRGLGFTQFDCQFINPHTASLGAYEMPERQYLKQLREGLKTEIPWRTELLPGP